MPPAVALLLRDQELKADKTFRDGPRFWVGRVHNTAGGAFVLKMVTNNTPWVNPITQVALYPSDKLRVESTMWREFGLLERSSPQGATWHLRPYQPGRSMAAGEGPFLFKDSFFTAERVGAVCRFIAGYQALTPKFTQFEALAPSSLSHYIELGPVSQPCAELEPLAVPIRAYLQTHQAVYDASQTTLGHREVYPPHIFFDGADAGLIDWENARLSTPQADFVTLWVRSFAWPSWQTWQLAWLKENGYLGSPAQELLWRTDVMLAAAGNLNYLAFSEYEPGALRSLAQNRLSGYITAILEDKPLTAI